MDDYERILLVKPDVHVYKIPPRVSNLAYRASDWNLDAPDWNCRLRLISKGDECFINLVEKSTGQFFGKCPIDKYPGQAIESVSDSSRYFVLRLVNEETGRTAFVGIGFIDRSDSFDLNVALQDHFKIVQFEHRKEGAEDNTPKLDLKFKEGETIKVVLNIGSKPSSAKSRPKSSNKGLGGGGILLPPPPSGSNKSQSNKLDTLHSTDHSAESSKPEPLIDSLDSLQISSSITTTENGSPPSSLLKLAEDKSTKTVPGNDDDDWFNFGNEKTSNNSSSVTTKKSNKDQSVDNNKDLWSDFASFTTNITSENTGDNDETKNQFDDWAKFS